MYMYVYMCTCMYILRETYRILSEQVFKSIKGSNWDGSGEIEYTSFLAACLDKRNYHEQSQLYQAFHRFQDVRVLFFVFVCVLVCVSLARATSTNNFHKQLPQTVAIVPGFSSFPKMCVCVCVCVRLCVCVCARELVATTNSRRGF